MLLNFFFFNDTATTEIYTLSLHDALPISSRRRAENPARGIHQRPRTACPLPARSAPPRNAQSSAHRPHRSEEHTSELQSHSDIVCRLLLGKKKIHGIIKNLDTPQSTSDTA